MQETPPTDTQAAESADKKVVRIDEGDSYLELKEFSGALDKGLKYYVWQTKTPEAAVSHFETLSPGKGASIVVALINQSLISRQAIKAKGRVPFAAGDASQAEKETAERERQELLDGDAIVFDENDARTFTLGERETGDSESSLRKEYGRLKKELEAVKNRVHAATNLNGEELAKQPEVAAAKEAALSAARKLAEFMAAQVE